MTLRLIHLSDIHFQGYDDGWDDDSDQRAELTRDVARAVRSDGAFDGILVGGDIAKSGRPSEYAVARAWLEDLCHVAGCTTSQIWTVPGNHDVDWGVLGRSPVGQQFRKELRRCGVHQIDNELRSRLSLDPAGEGLMAPLTAYNKFADDCGCAISAKSPSWYDPSLEVDGLSVRLTGLNSVLVSDGSDAVADDASMLLLGSWQCRLPRLDNTVHVAFAHHPPNWIRDWDLIEPYLRRAHLVLFGHEHVFSARQTVPMGTVEVFAGAVGPERLGLPPTDAYTPTYNFLTLSGAGDRLSVSVEPRAWDRTDTKFVEHPDGLSEFTIALDLEAVTPSPEPAEPGVEIVEPIPASPLTEDLDEEPVDGLSPSYSRQELREIGVRFMNRPPTQRRDIARRLNVLEEDTDLQLPPAERYPAILRRIRDRGLIPRLVEELARG